MQAITIEDAARAAGVSPATSAAARARVEAAATELGFLPNAQARSLRSTKTDSIALLISDVRNPYFSDLAHAVERHARAAGLVTFIGNANEDTGQQDGFLAAMLSRRVDGLLIVPQGLGEGSNIPSAMLQRVIDSPIPTVFVDRTVAGAGIPSITAGSRRALGQAVADLKARGHERIAFLGGPKHASTAEERRRAFDSALRSNGLVVDETLHFAGDFRRISGRAAARWFSEHDLSPTAVVIADAPMALGALTFWHEAGARIGQDFSVIQFRRGRCPAAACSPDRHDQPRPGTDGAGRGHCPGRPDAGSRTRQGSPREPLHPARLGGHRAAYRTIEQGQ
ncbi:substrate-binding domain-containing protein [Glutamicibacter sp. MNS18]|nr:substrate-binding domain-containing protein [Glutamicibacter sp. MNS18]MCW4465739.1 substrate-binding domain-containing protein [Glutamicibacter sp. MNS18]